MALLARKLGDTVTVDLAELVWTEEDVKELERLRAKEEPNEVELLTIGQFEAYKALADDLANAAVTATIRMVTGPVFDAWQHQSLAAQRAMRIEEAERKKAEKDGGSPSDEPLKATDLLVASVMRILSEGLAGLTNLHEDLNAETDGAKLAPELSVLGWVVLRKLATRIVREQSLSARQEKS